MRTVEDAVRLHDALESGDYKDAVVVGASMVGIKVAELLHKKGIHVTLADMASHIFALAAYPQVSEIIEDRIRAMGMDTAFGQAITSAEEHLDGQGNVTGYTVHLGDGSCLETEMLILNIGTRACTGILDPDEIAIDRGIVVDERMHTSAPDIFAAGDCCQGNNMQSGQTQIIGLWANAGVQGRVAGRNMAGVADETDGKPVGFNILDNHGISGILKAHLIKLLRGEPCRFTPEQRGQLVRYGLEQSFMDYLEASI